MTEKTPTLWRRALGVLLAVAGVASGMLALTAAVVAPARAAGPQTLTVWVSPAGSDINDGLSADTPFATLQHASDWLCGSTTACTGRGQPVEVRIAQTLIQVTAMTTWRYYDPGYPTTLEPWTYQPGEAWAQLSATGGLPTFDGGFTVDHALTFLPAGAGSGSTGLSFIYLRWQRFNISALDLQGGVGTTVNGSGVTVSWPLPDAANGVTFYGDFFYQIGNYWNPTHPMGWGAVDAYNSSGDTVTNCHFADLMNSAADAGHVHALYLSHHSDGTLVKGNAFTDITGDVVRQRDLTEKTLVTGNVFTRAGQYAYVDDWFCRPTLAAAKVCGPAEYASWLGTFTTNTLNGLYPEVIQIVNRRLTYCFDQPKGVCPANRWNTAG